MRKNAHLPPPPLQQHKGVLHQNFTHMSSIWHTTSVHQNRMLHRRARSQGQGPGMGLVPLPQTTSIMGHLPQNLWGSILSATGHTAQRSSLAVQGNGCSLKPRVDKQPMASVLEPS